MRRARTEDPHISALHHKRAARLGNNRPIKTVAQSIVVSAFSMLCRSELSQELEDKYVC